MYTWANNQEDPTFEKLDRVLVSKEWNVAYPLAVVTGLNRELSDHVPLHLNTRVAPPHSDMFRFENCLFEREGFVEMVEKSWTSPTYCAHDIDKWQEKARRFRRQDRGWHINMEGAFKACKIEILGKVDDIDKKNETRPLTSGERELKFHLDAQLKKLLRDDEIKWRQREHERDLKEGDGNTRYFQLKASGRKKKNYIAMLLKDGAEISRDKDLVNHIQSFIKACLENLRYLRSASGRFSAPSRQMRRGFS